MTPSLNAQEYEKSLKSTLVASVENPKIIIIQKTQNIYEILDLSGPNICKRIHAKTFFLYLNAKGN